MQSIEMIKELRNITCAGMKDCKEALEETNWDLQKAIDLLKIKGLNIINSQTTKTATEGRVVIGSLKNHYVMADINCQTDFVANSPQFIDFANKAADIILSVGANQFKPSLVENDHLNLISVIKEHIEIRRWTEEIVDDKNHKIFTYLHSNNKIGVLLVLESDIDNSEINNLGEDLAMQIAAINPLAISFDRIPEHELNRQKEIFKTQLKEEGRPEKMWDKIMEGKLRKWSSEVCLLEQESVIESKTSIKTIIQKLENKLNCKINLVKFTRYQVGEGLTAVKQNLAEEVEKLLK